MSNGKELWIARRKHQHLQPAVKYHNWVGYHSERERGGEREGERERARESEREREREGEGGRERRGSMQCFMKKEDKSRIDVKHV